jgi:hypothetical protein
VSAAPHDPRLRQAIDQLRQRAAEDEHKHHRDLEELAAEFHARPDHKVRLEDWLVGRKHTRRN